MEDAISKTDLEQILLGTWDDLKALRNDYPKGCEDLEEVETCFREALEAFDQGDLTECSYLLDEANEMIDELDDE